MNPEDPFDPPPQNPWGDPNAPPPPPPPQYQPPAYQQNPSQQGGFNEPQFFKGQLPGTMLGNETLPNSTLILVFGIIGIVFGCGLIGLIINIVNLVLASSAQKLVVQNPGRYSIKSYKQMKAGRVCSVIGLIMLPITVVIYVIIAATGDAF